MKYNYDEYYRGNELFGKPYAALLEFFKQHEPKGTVLDLGCGQGRDSIPIGRIGYRVIGIDESELGLAQMNEVCKKEQIDVIGIKDDIYTYKITDDYDIILMDSMLHFYKNDIDQETSLVHRIASEMKQNGILCNCMIRGKKREQTYKRILDETIEFELIEEKYVDFPEFNSKYHMHIVRKVRNI